MIEWNKECLYNRNEKVKDKENGWRSVNIGIEKKSMKQTTLKKNE